MKNYHIFNNQGKGTPYAFAAAAAGYQLGRQTNSKIYLSDVDIPGRVKPFLGLLERKQASLYVYPHSARPNLVWDGLHEPCKHTACSFVTTEGHKKAILSYGYSKPLLVVGWTFCPLVHFRPSLTLKNVLFAPLHPNKRGWLSDSNKKINAHTFQILNELCQEHEINLDIRYIGELSSQGLKVDPYPNYIPGMPDMSYKMIDDYDLIVSSQTFASLAVARGKPTLMMGEDRVPCLGKKESDIKYVKSWDKYKDIVMYPLDILEADDPWMLMQYATKTDESIRDWREQMVGDMQFDPAVVIKAFEKYT